MPKLVWSKDKIKLIEDMIIAGYKQSEMADRLGVSQSSIRNAIKKHTDGCKAIRERNGLNPLPFVRNGHMNWYDEGVKSKLIGMIQSGATIRQIADEFEMTERATASAIYNHTDGLRVLRHRAGLPLNIT